MRSAPQARAHAPSFSSRLSTPNGPVSAAKRLLQRLAQRHHLSFLALVPFLASLWLFRISPPLAIALQLFLLLALVGKLPLFILAIFVAMPFQQSLLGGESNSSANISLVDVLAATLFLALLSSLPARRTLRLGPIALPIFVYIGILCASSLANWEGFTTGISLLRMIMATLIAVLIFANFRIALILAHRGFLFFLASLSILALFTILAFAQGGIEASMYTLGINKNSLGATFGCGIVVCLCYLLTEKEFLKRTHFLRVALALCTIGCFFSLSRGAWLATTVAFLTFLLIVKNRRAFWIYLLLMVPLITVLWQLLPQSAAEYAADISLSAHTLQTRLETMSSVMDAFRSSPLMGVGIGLRKFFEPHNVLILTLGESGIIGLLGFLGMFGSGFYTFYRAFQKTEGDLPNRQLVLIGISILILSLVHGCMDVYWRRGIGFLGWAGVGLAVQILAQSEEDSRAQRPIARGRAAPMGRLKRRALR